MQPKQTDFLGGRACTKCRSGVADIKQRRTISQSTRRQSFKTCHVDDQRHQRRGSLLAVHFIAQKFLGIAGKPFGQVKRRDRAFLRHIVHTHKRRVTSCSSRGLSWISAEPLQRWPDPTCELPRECEFTQEDSELRHDRCGAPAL